MKISRYLTGPIQVNTYVAYDEETMAGFMVDPGGYVSAITDQIKKDGINLQYIILTHGHGDHIGGVEGYRRDFPAVKVVAHRDERELLMDGNLNGSAEIANSRTSDVQYESTLQYANKFGDHSVQAILKQARRI